MDGMAAPAGEHDEAPNAPLAALQKIRAAVRVLAGHAAGIDEPV